MSATVTTLTPTIGVEITGLSGSELVDRQAADQCQAALDEHGVVVYREVNIDDEDLLAFSRMLGTLVVQPTGEHKYPEIQTITLDPSKTNVMLAAYRQGTTPSGRTVMVLSGGNVERSALAEILAY